MPALNDRRMRCVWSDAMTDMRLSALVSAMLVGDRDRSLSFGNDLVVVRIRSFDQPRDRPR